MNGGQDFHSPYRGGQHGTLLIRGTSSSLIHRFPLAPRTPPSLGVPPSMDIPTQILLFFLFQT